MRMNNYRKKGTVNSLIEKNSDRFLNILYDSKQDEYLKTFPQSFFHLKVIEINDSCSCILIF